MIDTWKIFEFGPGLTFNMVILPMELDENWSGFKKRFKGSDKRRRQIPFSSSSFFPNFLPFSLRNTKKREEETEEENKSLEKGRNKMEKWKKIGRKKLLKREKKEGKNASIKTRALLT